MMNPSEKAAEKRFLKYKLIAFSGLCMAAATIMHASKEIPALSESAQAAMPVVSRLAFHNHKTEFPFLNYEELNFSTSQNQSARMPRYGIGIQGTPFATQQASGAFAQLISSEHSSVLKFGPSITVSNRGNNLAQRRHQVLAPWKNISLHKFGTSNLDKIQSKLTMEGAVEITLPPTANIDKPYVFWAYPTITKNEGPVLAVGTSTKKDFDEAVSFENKVFKNKNETLMFGMGSFFLLAIGIIGMLGRNDAPNVGDKLKKRRPESIAEPNNALRIAQQ